MPPDAAHEHARRPLSPAAALAMVTVVFFLFGFVSTLGNVLVPHLQGVFQLDYTAGALVQLAFFSAYLLASLPSGAIVTRMGPASALAVGLATGGAGALLFQPAAALRSYPLFLVGLFVLAAGITLLQVAANPYVAALGRPETAASRLNLAQAFNSVGATIAPYVGGLLLLTHERDAAAVQLPYLVIAAALLLLALLFRVVPLPAIPQVGGPAAGAGSIGDALRVRHLSLGMIGIFAYVGAETAIGSFLVAFLGAPEVAGLPREAASRWVSYYWGGAMLGRFAGAAALRVWDAGRVLAVCAAAAAALAVTGAFASGPLAMTAMVAVGLCNSIMFPTIFGLGITRLGRLTSAGSSLLIMAVCGGAVVPVMVGWLADRVGIHRALGLTAVSYLYIVSYGLWGSRPR